VIDALLNRTELNRTDFQQRFRFYIILSWTLPPVFGLSFLLYINMFSLEQMGEVLSTPLEPGFIIGTLVFAIWYFNRFIQPVLSYLDQPDDERGVVALKQVRIFPLHFWGVFLVYLLAAPSSVIISAEYYSDFVARPVDWFRIHLVALIVSIIVGLPIFFKVLDLLGRAMGSMRLERPTLTIRTKVFLIGALVPLLVDTMLVQYYWTRTGYFTYETFAIWAFLQILAIAGSLMFAHSFGQSLSPLENVVAGELELDEMPSIRACSTDELGVLAGRYQGMLEHTYLRRQALEVGNRFLRSGGSEISRGETYDQLVAICREALAADMVFLMLHDADTDELVSVSQTGNHYRHEGHVRVSLDEPSLAVLVFKEKRLTVIEDVEGDYRVSPRMVKKFAIKSAIGVPLVVEEKTVGALMAVTQGRIRHFSARDCDLIDLLAREAAAVVHTQRLQSKRQQAEELSRVTLRSIGDGVVTTDVAGRVKFLNPVAEQMTGWVQDEAQGLPLAQVLQLIDETSGTAVADPVARCLQGGGTFSLPGKTLLRAKEGGREYSLDVRVSPIREAGARVHGVVLVFHDTTELAMLSHRLSYQASHDALTGLVNRHEFEARLELALESCRHEGIEHALCFMDLDQFKVVNDTCGHTAGDELLKQLGVRMRATIREADTVARLGGDEFGLLLEGCHLEQARNVANSILEMVRDFRFVWEDKVFDVGISIGLVAITADSGNITDVLSSADSACYVAKERGRNRLHVFEADDLTLSQRKSEMLWLQQLRRALEEDNFRLFYQPIHSLGNSSRRYYGEILLRLEENDELIPPNAFLPTAERYHLMPEVDRWVVRNALRILGERGNGETEVYFSINLSAQSLSDEHFLDFVLEELRNSKVAAQSLCFEVTETTAIANLSRAIQLISALKKEGCQFALDDFGSGLSSFNYLKNLPVDYLKIDGAFVQDMDTDPLDLAMVDSINRIGHLMGIQTVAEFVGSDAVVNELKTLGVDYAQGYHIGMPQPVEQALAALR
jgi:diguanylate cyclase (GGDEF)-like protein/PAS domain S-box-containing protein